MGTMTNTTYAQAIEKHYTKQWRTPMDRVRWDKGPVEELPEEFRVLVIKRSSEMVAYATLCMSQPDDTGRLELHMLASPDQALKPHFVEMLTIIAHYHRTGSQLALGHSVNFGQPLVPESNCTHGLISLPYLDGPKLEWMANPKVRFLWLVPITQEELAFKKTHGMEALEERFEEKQFNYLDLFRPSVV
jgi:hypothetical protein